MRHTAHEAARNFLDGFAEDIVNTNDADFEIRLEEWMAQGFPELAFYRDDRPRDRGEIIAEIRKAQRALDGDERALTQATRDELPVLAGALRVAAQTVMNGSGGQNVFVADASNAGRPTVIYRDGVDLIGEPSDEPTVIFRDGLAVPAPGGETASSEFETLAPNQTLRGAGQQLRKPKHMAGEFLAAGNLINHSLEQRPLGRIANGDAPHLFVKPREQDEVLNNPSHKFNIYANASPEERGELNQAAYDKAFALAQDWIKHRRRLDETPDRPKFKTDPAANMAGQIVDKGLKGLRKLPGFDTFADSDDVLLQTLRQHGYNDTDPESVAIAIMDPAFEADLNKNIRRFLRGAAKDAGKDALKAAGNALRRFLP